MIMMVEMMMMRIMVLVMNVTGGRMNNEVSRLCRK